MPLTSSPADCDRLRTEGHRQDAAAGIWGPQPVPTLTEEAIHAA
jgi:hypothetical protein